jgi:hypothetical protein
VASANRSRWLNVIAVLTIAVPCAGQTTAPPKKTAPKVRPAVPSFVCPDADAQQACKSYEELLKANDSGILNQDYVCFQKNQDKFFVVRFSKPHFSKKWDPDLKQMIVDSEAKSTGIGDVKSYKEGVQNLTMMPSLIFSGTWVPYPDPESGTFRADSVNFKKKQDDDPVVVFIDESQFAIDGYKYQNTSGKTIIYNLTIQRSTGRFTEKFQDEPNNIPFSESSGHCRKRE